MSIPGCFYGWVLFFVYISMSTNLQPIPGGLVGFKDTPHQTYIHDDVTNYTVVNSDQVILCNSDTDIVFDPSVLADGKIFYIKNVYIKDLIIDGGGGLIDGMNTFTIKINEAVTLLYKRISSTDVFYILGKYKSMVPVADFIVKTGSPMEDGDTQYQNDTIEFPPAVYIDGILLTYDNDVTDRRYVSYNSSTRTITINNGTVVEGENIQIYS